MVSVLDANQHLRMRQLKLSNISKGIKMLHGLNTIALLLGYGVIIISVLLLIITIILISIPTIEYGVMSKFAWLPTKVETWRDPSPWLS